MRIAFSILLGVIRLGAQSTFATITGTVADAKAGTIPNVTVIATHVATNISLTGVSNEAGIFSLAGLKEGQYTVRAEATGFKELVVENVELASHDIRRLDLQLEVGGIHETVRVTSQTDMIETETPRINDLKTARELNSLPTNNRGIFYEFGLSSMSFVPNGAYWPEFAGSRFGQWDTSWDGTPTMDGFGNSALSNITQTDAIQEVRLDMVNNSAEFGQMAQFTLVSKSGTNEIHGTAFEYYQSPAFRARNPFALVRGTGISHFPGFSLGGPLVIPRVYNGKNRTFWFIDGERTAGSQQTVSLNPTVPLAAWRKGDFSGLGVPILNPFTGEIYQDGRIPASAINPVSEAIQDRFYPLPNFGDTSILQSQNFRSTFGAPFSPDYEAVARFDQKLGNRNYIYGSYVENQLRNNQWEGNLPTFGPRYQLRQQKGFNLAETFTIGSSMVNELRVGYAYNGNPRWGPINGLQEVQSLGLTGLASNLPDIGGLYQPSFSGIAVTALSQVPYANPGSTNKVWTWVDQFSYQHGRHGIKGGLTLSRIGYFNKTASSCLFGCGTFADTYSRIPGVANSGSAYADFLFGVPASASIASPPVPTELHRTSWDFFAQDEWKVTQRLTLNFGLRYEYHPGWTEASGRLAMFDVNSGSIVVADKGMDMISPLMPSGYVKIVSASSIGLPGDTLLRSNTKDFGPRMGFAFRPFDANTVVRGGYGIYYNSSPGLPSAAGTPFVISVPSYTNTTQTPTLVLPQVFPSTGIGGPSSISLPAAFNPNLRTPYSQQWSFTVEHQIGDTAVRASYVGTATRQMLYLYDINAPPPDGQLYISKPRRFPNYPGIAYEDNGASHSYNGVSIEVKRRITNGLEFQSSWTWARDIGDDCGDTCTDPGQIENPIDRARDRGPSQSTPKYRFVTSGIYQLPFGTHRKWLNHASRGLNLMAGGWQIAAIAIYSTGQFLTPIIEVPDPTGTAFTTVAGRPLISIRPDVVGDPNFSHPAVNGWFNVNAFAAPPVGRFGNAGRGVIVGPGTNKWNVGVYKYVVFSESPRVPKLRLEFAGTNIFNHPNWSNPDMNLSDGSSAGTISGVGGTIGYDALGPRAMRCGIRVEW